MSYIYKFSASDLIKRSASQILFFMLRNKKRKITKGMREGAVYQDKVATSEFLEMRGIHEVGKDCAIFFTWDEIIPGYLKNYPASFIEVKMVKDESYPEWYFNSSILQTAFYGAMSKKCDEYYTAKFARKAYKTKYLDTAGQTKEFVLNFGGKKYFVECNSNKIISHFEKKVDTIIAGFEDQDFEGVRNWDRKFKFKEFEKLKKHILWRLRK